MIIAETKVSGPRAKEITDRLRLDGAIHANNISYTGGRWILWDSIQVEISELSSTEQEIHVVVKDLSLNSSWLMSAVYASPRYVERRLLWDNLSKVAKLHTLPWIIAGDFNEVLLGEENFGGRLVSISRAVNFQECLNTYGMIDLGFSGPWYTWTNQQPLPHLVQERIDRVFVNADWNVLYLEACVKHLERSHSDHSPVLLSLRPDHGNHHPRPFRKRRNCARLKRIQTALGNNPNNFLVELEKLLLCELSHIANLEAEFWSMKSRISWVVEGDKNTVFFHNSTLFRRRRNRITSMKDRMGNWLIGEHEISFFIRQGFLDLFTTSQCSAALKEWQPPFWKSRLNMEDIAQLELLVTDKESLLLYDVKNCRAVRDVLDTFCGLSSQKVSAEKSRVVFSPNLAPHTREELCDILQFRSTPTLGKYLGLPIKHTSIPQDFGAIVERVQTV
ncbi:hypothetical protein SO802_033173 [Lithocarpus litseifolius]|uniref:Endonuclease/exonuclease/phosphatase domain-containing protein n=1 Tax=Lithocarpus litseifolius TaxID=425828 RepID=A0AAW2BDP6_9ROSI